VDALGRAATDEDESVRTAAIGFLAGQPTVYATDLLVDLLRSTPAPERVLDALSVHSDARVHGVLAALETADDQLAQQLTSALARMHHRDATMALVSALSIANVAGRKAAAMSLAAMRHSTGMQALERSAASDPDQEVRRICTLLLAD
jgi:HEAT repeat protein